LKNGQNALSKGTNDVDVVVHDSQSNNSDIDDGEATEGANPMRGVAHDIT